jgi:hypothetical protein
MLKSLLLASALTLAFSGAAMAGDASSAGAAGCSSCALPTSNAIAPVKMAQVQQAQIAGRTAAVKGDWEQNPKESRICCDPQINTMKIGVMFNYDPNVVPVSGSKYGLKFNPTPAFKAAIDNTAFMANVLLGLPYSHFIVRANMRTDNGPNQSWPLLGSTPSASLYYGGLNSSHDLGGMQNLYVEDSPLGQMAFVHTPYAFPFGTPTHMRADGTRYAVKFTYWVAYWHGDPRTGQWVAVPVNCANLLPQYLGVNPSSSVAKVIGGQQGTGGIISDSAPSTENAPSMTFGTPVVLSADEVKQLNLRKQQ